MTCGHTSLKTQGFNFRDDAEAAEAGAGDHPCLHAHHPSWHKVLPSGPTDTSQQLKSGNLHPY